MSSAIETLKAERKRREDDRVKLSEENKEIIERGRRASRLVDQARREVADLDEAIAILIEGEKAREARER